MSAQPNDEDRFTGSPAAADDLAARWAARRAAERKAAAERAASRHRAAEPPASGAVDGARPAASEPTAAAPGPVRLEAFAPGGEPRPVVSVAVVLLSVREEELRVVLLRRTEEPAAGLWELPGSVVGRGIGLDEAAAAALASSTGVGDAWLEQFHTFGSPNRDARGHVIAVAHVGLIDPVALERSISGHDVVAKAIVRGEDAGIRVARLVVPWEGDSGGAVGAVDDAGVRLPLAFDHPEILGRAVAWLRRTLPNSTVGFEMLPERFSLRDVRRVHEVVTGRHMNKDSFRRRVLDRGLVTATGQRASGVGHRPPELYRFADPAALEIAGAAAAGLERSRSASSD